MASNFKILVHKNEQSAHFKLWGDFDGTSAHELIRSMNKHGLGVERIFVHTDGLNKVIPFGRDIFRNSLTVSDCRSGKLVFTGSKADEFAPESEIVP